LAFFPRRLRHSQIRQRCLGRAKHRDLAIRPQVSKGRAKADGKCAPRRRKGFAPHLERIETVIEPEELAEHVGKQKVLIGKDVSERLDVAPAKFCVIVTRLPRCLQGRRRRHRRRRPRPISSKEAFRRSASGPNRRRQICRWPAALPAGAIYARDHDELDRPLMAQWMGKLGFQLEIMAD